jgi:hypothetical protein
MSQTTKIVERSMRVTKCAAAAWMVVVVAACSGALAARPPAREGGTQAHPSAAPTPGTLEEHKAQAVELLGAAIALRAHGDLGLALEHAQQAQELWPAYPEAEAFLNEVRPQATTVARDAQATAAAQEAQAQATAAARQAQATATAAAQQARMQATATAQAWAQGTAYAALAREVTRPRLTVTGGPPGGKASVSAETVPGASCQMSYTGPRGTARRAEGLAPKTADANGRVSWTWAIATNARQGAGEVVVNCDGVSTTAAIEIG